MVFPKSNSYFKATDSEKFKKNYEEWLKKEKSKEGKPTSVKKIEKPTNNENKTFQSPVN